MTRVFQEMCFDVYQPSGAGRRRRDLALLRGVAGAGAAGAFGRSQLSGAPGERRGRDELVRLNSREMATAFTDNVGVTVVMPGGQLVIIY